MERDTLGTATYSPEDNKLRIYPFHRLPRETYDEVKAAGYQWAPKQECFYTPAWTPWGEALALRLCGEIDDEDTTLRERAEDRAERFATYESKRRADYRAARAGVAAIADNIPMGQPILIGHHSQRRAEKDAERIEAGMRRAIRAFETADYWERRAAACIQAAKYKELPGVRARRIKGLEADARKFKREIADARAEIKLWCWPVCGLSQEKAAFLSGNTPSGGRYRKFNVNGEEKEYSTYGALREFLITPAQAREWVYSSNMAMIRGRQKWLTHTENRLVYERAMLAEAGGLAVAGVDMTPGGRVLVGSTWYTITRVNKSGGAANSVTVAPRGYKVGIEEIKEYQAPSEEAAAAIKAATKLPPLINERFEGCEEMAKAEYDRRVKHGYAHTRKEAATPEHGAHRYRVTMARGCRLVPVFITDMPEKKRPAPATVAAPSLPQPERAADAPPPRTYTPKDTSEIDALRDAARAGVSVVAAPQLFPTPPDIARQMVELAGGMIGQSVLEPSAGTGNLIKAIENAATGADNVHPVAIEINAALCEELRRVARLTIGSRLEVVQADFLTQTPETIGMRFSRIIMNPPFGGGADIKHILHALEFLKPGGVLVALCANGPRQVDALAWRADVWRELPAGSFKEQGTGVNVAMLRIVKSA